MGLVIGSFENLDDFALISHQLFERAIVMMSPNEKRKLRREARRASLRGVAAAPSFKSIKKKRTRRSPLRRALVIGASLVVLIGMSVAAPKLAHATPPPDAPEIDPGSMAGAMTLLVGGVLALTDRNRRS
jgi:hypothetical protein